MAGQYQYPAHEGLQFNGPDHTAPAPEVYQYHNAAPEIAPQGYVSPEKASPHLEQHSPVADQPKRWCGIPKRRALIIGNGSGNSSSSSDASNAGATASASSTSDAPVTSAATTTSSASTGSASPTSTSTSTSSAFPTPSNNILSLNCPAINNTQFTVEGSSFEVYCLTDFRSGSGNIAQSLEPSINDCIGSCVTYNTENESSDRPCQGLTFGANLTRYGGANCFLKTGPLTRFAYTIDDFQAGAILLG